jgi:hypothetical protein
VEEIYYFNSHNFNASKPTIVHAASFSIAKRYSAAIYLLNYHQITSEIFPNKNKTMITLPGENKTKNCSSPILSKELSNKN